MSSPELAEDTLNEMTSTHYHIGTAARLTGSSTDKLRIWERRYRVVAPVRTSSGKRLYADHEIRRLRMIKQLVDRGDTISSIAGLSDESLRQRLQATEPTLSDASTAFSVQPPKVVVFGSDLALRLARDRSIIPGVELVSVQTEWSRFLSECEKRSPDAVVAQFKTLQPTTVEQLLALRAELPAPRLVVQYGFAASNLIERLRQAGIATLRAPVDFSALAEACTGGSQGAPEVDLGGDFEVEPADFEIAPRRFADEELAEMALQSARLNCECPAHLVELIIGLSGFETYSRECEHRNARDAQIHRLLCARASQARALVEDALARLAEAEDLQTSGGAAA